MPPSTPPWVDSLRQQLQRAFAEKRFSQQRLADEAGITQPAVSQFINGDTTVPNADFLIAGCKLLGLSVDHLVGLRGHEAAAVHAPNAEAIAEARKQLERLAGALLLVSGAANSARRQTAKTGDDEPGAVRGNRKRR